ncbi:MAG: hypothetical protein M3P27_00295 [Acidobacteriota bacterium]|nr:hypothetical protein [Acidobacteriota bacterium]
MNLRWCNVAARVCLFAMLIVPSLAGVRTAAAQNAPAKPPSAAAPDYSGRYSFLQDGEDVQLNQAGSKIDGYIERFGDGDSDRDTMLQHTFSKATLDGDKLSFSTKPVHAIWYEFKGKAVRGAAKTRAEDGYYQLVGTLTEHRQKDGKEAGAKSRPVTLRLFAEEPEK